MAAPPLPAAPAAKQRKKPGPKPKAKPAPPSLIAKLKIRPELLATIESLAGTPTTGATPNGSSPTGTSPQPSVDASESVAVAPGQKRKGVPGPKPGTKRPRAPGAPPAKPGRKKAKLWVPSPPVHPGVVYISLIYNSDSNLPPGSLSAATHGTSKLGPKANTGAINDKLRALDRTGKPCKRWSKAGFTVKSFTGVQWMVPTWAAPKSQNHSPDSTAAADSLNASAEPSVVADTPPDVKMTDLPRPMVPELKLPEGIVA
jgi:hypothetical protein